jgi:hypothetical protein
MTGHWDDGFDLVEPSGPLRDRHQQATQAVCHPDLPLVLQPNDQSSQHAPIRADPRQAVDRPRMPPALKAAPIRQLERTCVAAAALAVSDSRFGKQVS